MKNNGEQSLKDIHKNKQNKTDLSTCYNFNYVKCVYVPGWRNQEYVHNWNYVSLETGDFKNFFFQNSFCWYYSWPLNNTGLNSMGPLTCGYFFIVNTIVPGFQVARWLRTRLPMQETRNFKFHLRRFSGGWHGNPLQCSCLEDPMDRGAWHATIHRVAKGRTGMKDWACAHTHTIVLQDLYLLVLGSYVCGWGALRLPALENLSITLQLLP